MENIYLYNDTLRERELKEEYIKYLEREKDCRVILNTTYDDLLFDDLLFDNIENDDLQIYHAQQFISYFTDEEVLDYIYFKHDLAECTDELNKTRKILEDFLNMFRKS